MSGLDGQQDPEQPGTIFHNPRPGAGRLDGPARPRDLDRVEEDLQRQFPGTEIPIDVDPEGQIDRETDPGRPAINRGGDMTSIPFFQVDGIRAGTTDRNPAAVMPPSAGLDDCRLMQAIAAESNLSESSVHGAVQQRRCRLRVALVYAGERSRPGAGTRRSLPGISW